METKISLNQILLLLMFTLRLLKKINVTKRTIEIIQQLESIPLKLAEKTRITT